MEQQSRLRKDPTTEGPDRYDNDTPAPDVDHDEYQARLERNRKHAAWRTEMALRLRNSGYRPARPDSAF